VKDLWLLKGRRSFGRGGLRMTLLFLFVFSFLSFANAATASNVTLPTHVSDRRFATELLWRSFKLLPKNERPRVILVLGGGGARGLSHIGVLRVLEQEQIPVDEIVGVSVGALIGSLYAAGLPVEKIESMAHDIGWDKLTGQSKISMLRLLLSNELVPTARMETYLNKYMGKKTFADLRIPFLCVATDMQSGQRVILKDGPVAPAARASATIPGLFQPVTIDGHVLVDGGLVDNLPTNVADIRPDWDVVIAVLPHVDVTTLPTNTVYRTLIRSLEIQRDVIVAQNREHADVLIEPQVSNIGFADLDKSVECVDAGVRAARLQALEIKKVLLRRVTQGKPR
jgi:NTE family protein